MMKEGKDTETGIVCPFCGAPYKKIIPSNVALVKCGYCGDTFRIPSHLGDVARCINHPEALATDFCNDCGGHFCYDCLTEYKLRAKSEEATIYLCHECLYERKIKQANSYILKGSLGSILFLIFLWIGGAYPKALVTAILFAIFFIPILIYGLYRRVALPKPSNTSAEDNQS